MFPHRLEIQLTDIVEIGDITYVSPDGLGFWCNTTLPPGLYPSASDYIFFSKDNKANQASVLGYYAKVQLKNNSKTEAEIFGVSADAFESSK